MAMILDIADAVVEELSAGSFSLAFTPKRSYMPQFDLEALATLRVTVVPKGLEIARSSRSGKQGDYRIDIGVQKKFEEAGAAELDPLMDLVEEIADYFDGRALSTDPASVCVGIANEPIFAPEHVREMREFTSVLTLTFRTWR